MRPAFSSAMISGVEARVMSVGLFGKARILRQPDGRGRNPASACVHSLHSFGKRLGPSASGSPAVSAPALAQTLCEASRARFHEYV